MTPDVWTDKDVAILRECYAPNGGGREAAIARLSHRTVSAGLLATLILRPDEVES